MFLFRYRMEMGSIRNNTYPSAYYIWRMVSLSCGSRLPVLWAWDAYRIGYLISWLDGIVQVGRCLESMHLLVHSFTWYCPPPHRPPQPLHMISNSFANKRHVHVFNIVGNEQCSSIIHRHGHIRNSSGLHALVGMRGIGILFRAINNSHPSYVPGACSTWGEHPVNSSYGWFIKNN